LHCDANSGHDDTTVALLRFWVFDSEAYSRRKRNSFSPLNQVQLVKFVNFLSGQGWGEGRNGKCGSYFVSAAKRPLDVNHVSRYYGAMIVDYH